MEFHEDGQQLIKSVPNTRHVFQYDLSETVEQAGLHDEAAHTVVYGGRVVPRSIAKFREKLVE
jgi:hypothetical protein